jgi:hypothetical protein
MPNRPPITPKEAVVLSGLMERTYLQSPSKTHIYASDLVNETHLSHVAVANILRSLEQKGYVRRIKNNRFWVNGKIPMTLQIRTNIMGMSFNYRSRGQHVVIPLD